MRVLSLVLLGGLWAGPVWAQGAPNDPDLRLNWDQDKVVEVEIAEPGQEGIYWFEIRQPGYLVIEPFFPPREAGTVTLGVISADEEAVATLDQTAEDAGVYGIRVKAAEEFTGAVPVEIELLAPLDLTEPNDTADTAREIELPFAAVIQFNTSKDQDWFTFRAPGNGVLGVHLDVPHDREGPQFRLQDDEENVVYQLPNDNFSHAAMKYMPVSSGRYHLVAWDTINRRGANRFATLRIEYYPERGSSIGSPGIGTVDFETEGDGYAQLEQISRATGAPLIQADTPEQISQALEDALREEGIAWYWWVLLILLLGGAGYAGWWFWQSRAQDKPALKTPDSTTDSTD